MKTKMTSNLATSITMALVPFGPLALFLPAGEVVMGLLVIAALGALGFMEFQQGSSDQKPRRQT